MLAVWELLYFIFIGPRNCLLNASIYQDSAIKPIHSDSMLLLCNCLILYLLC
jgi:hypothetical protein